MPPSKTDLPSSAPTSQAISAKLQSAEKAKSAELQSAKSCFSEEFDNASSFTDNDPKRAEAMKSCKFLEDKGFRFEPGITEIVLEEIGGLGIPFDELSQFPKDDLSSICEELTSCVSARAKEIEKIQNTSELTHSINQKKLNISEQGKRLEKKEIIKKQLKTNQDALSELKKRIPKGKKSLSTWKTELDKLSVETKENGETVISKEVAGRVFELIKQAQIKLQAVNSLFTPEEQSKIGDITKMDVNLAAENEAEKYATIYQAVESAGIFTDEEQKRKKLKEVAKILGIPGKKELAKGAGQLKSQLYLRGKQVAQGDTENDNSPAPIEKENAVVLRESPLIIAYSNPSPESDFICEGRVENSDPILLPFNQNTPNTVLNAQMNQHFFRAVASNHGGHGVLASMLGTGTALSGGVEEQTETAAFGTNQMMETILQMELGQNTILYSRFLNPEELEEIADNMRFKVPQGDFGAFNAIDPGNQATLLRGLGFSKSPEGQKAMLRAGDLSRGEEIEKSYESLYRLMYPEDEDFTRLKGIIGVDLFERLEF